MTNWKDVVGYEDFYQVSDSGNIRSKDRIVNRGVKGIVLKKGKILILNDSKDYKHVTLVDLKGKKSYFLVHRIVAISFLSNEIGHPVINHKDGNKHNNSVNNLEWCTYSHNNKYALENRLKIPLKGTQHKMAKLREKEIFEIIALRKDGKSKAFISEYFNISIVTINRILRGDTWKHLINQNVANINNIGFKSNTLQS